MYSTPEILDKEMDYLHHVLLKNNCLERMTKQQEKKHSTQIIHPESGIGNKKSAIMSVPYVPGFSEEFRRIFQLHQCTGNLQR